LALAVLAMPAQAQRASAVFVDSPSPQLLANDSFTLSATAYDSSGNALKPPITWSTSDKTAITVDPDGTVHGVGLGWADVSADVTGARGTVRLQVVPLAINVHPANQTVMVGTSIQYSADVLDKNSQPLSNVALQWRVYGPNASNNNGAAVDSNGNVFTFGFGTYFVEAYFNYTVGAGPFIGRYFGNTLLTVLPPPSYTQTKLLDSGAVRQTFQLRPRRGQMSVNDSGQVAYTGSLEGFANAALVWNSGVFTPVAVASNPAELPGSNLTDIDDPALNNNGEIATRCQLSPGRTAMLFGASDGTPHMILFDGSSGGGVTNIRNFVTTRFSLNDNSVILFRADYQNIGSTTNLTGLFSVNPSGSVQVVVPAAKSLPGLGSTYTFDRDFGLANDGSVLFFATNGSSRALYRIGPDLSLARVVGTGDQIDGANVTSLGNVAVGKNGQYAVEAYNGNQNVFLFNGDPSSRQKTTLTNYRNIYAVNSAGEALVYADPGPGLGMYRWNGTTFKQALLIGTPSPSGDLYTQFDSAGSTARGEVIVQARTANNLLVVVNAGTSPTATPSVVFQTGTIVNASAGPAFANLVLNGHSGNPMIKTGQYYPNVFEIASGALLPRLVDGDLLPGGWFYEGNQDTRRTANGDLIVATDDSLSRISGSSATTLAHFPQRTNAGMIYPGYQIAASVSGTVAITGGTNFGLQQISGVQNSVATPIAWLGSNGQYQTNSPSGGFFNQSLDIGADESGNVYANLRVSGGPDGLFVYSNSSWQTVLKIGDTFDGRPVISINQIRVAGNACFALIATSGNVMHLSRYQNGSWTDLVNSGDALPTGNAINSTYGINTFDANRNGAVVAIINANGGVQNVLYTDGNTSRIAADSDHQMPSGEYIGPFLQIGLNDDGRIFATALNQDALMVLYEFDPTF
jgi:hypothetical protein